MSQRFVTKIKLSRKVFEESVLFAFLVKVFVHVTSTKDDTSRVLGKKKLLVSKENLKRGRLDIYCIGAVSKKFPKKAIQELE